MEAETPPVTPNSLFVEAPSQFLAQLHYRVCALTTSAGEGSLLTKMLAHQGKKSEKSRSKAKQLVSRKKRVESTIFTVDVLTKLKEIFEVTDQKALTYQTEVERGLHSKASHEEKLDAFYNVLIAITLMLAAQKNVLITVKEDGKDVVDQKAVTSVFLNHLLNELNAVLSLGNKPLVKKNKLDPRSSKRIQDEDPEIVRVTLLNVMVGVEAYLKECRVELDAQTTQSGLSASVQRKMEYFQANALEGLIQYCATQEKDPWSNSEKRRNVLSIVSHYLMASSPKDFKKLFVRIAKGIEGSRAKGKQGEKSSGSEKMLVQFRDALVDVIFMNEQANGVVVYSKKQILAILESISRVGAASSSNVLRLVAQIETPETRAEMNRLRVGLMQRLIIDIPRKINGELMTYEEKAKYCHAQGLLWAKEMTRLIQDPLLDPELRKILGVLTFIWNDMMEVTGEENPDFFVPQRLIGFDVVAVDPRLSKFLQRDLGAYLKTFPAVVQSILAPYYQMHLGREEKYAFPPEFADAPIDIVEQQIQEDRIASMLKAIDLIKTHVLVIPLDPATAKPVDKAQVCVDSGVRWPRAMNALLRNCKLNEAQLTEVGVCAALWNFYVTQKRVGNAVPEFFALQHAVSLDVIMNHPLVAGPLYKEFRAALAVACKSNVARVQAKLARGYQASLRVEFDAMEAAEAAHILAATSLGMFAARKSSREEIAMPVAEVTEGNKSPTLRRSSEGESDSK